MSKIHLTIILSQVRSSQRAKTAQQGKQMRIGAREGFACHTVKTGFTG